MSMKLASTSTVRPLTVVEPLSDVAQRYGVRLNVQRSIGGGGVIGAFTGMSAAHAATLAPIATTTALLRNKFFMATNALGCRSFKSKWLLLAVTLGQLVFNNIGLRLNGCRPVSSWARQLFNRQNNRQ